MFNSGLQRADRHSQAAITPSSTLAILIFVIVLSLSAQAQHPYLWLDGMELTFIRGKVAADTADWQALRTQCDAIAGVGSIPYAVEYPHASNGGSSPTRGYTLNPTKSPGLVNAGYEGGLWDDTIEQLGACYQAIRTTDPTRAAAYLLEAHYILEAMTQPLLQMVRQTDGLVRYAASVDARGNDLLAGAQAQVYQPYSSAKSGDIWTITGAQGCTSLNGTFLVQAIGTNTILLEHTNGTASALNANCTLFSVSPTAGAAFSARFYMAAIAKAYDWFYGDGIYGGLIAVYPGDIINVVHCITAWTVELQYVTYGAHPETNYAAGYIWGAAAVYVAFNSDEPAAIGGPASQVLIQHFSGPNEFAQYNNLWLAGGGNGEGLQAYGYDSIYRILEAEYALWDYQITSGGSYGVDWRKPPANFTLLDDTLKYMMEFVTPTLLAEDGNEYVFPAGSVYCPDKTSSTNPCAKWFPTEPVYLNLSQQAAYTAFANRMSSTYAAQFQNFYDAVYSAEQAASGVTVPSWTVGSGNPYQSSPKAQSAFLWYNPEALNSTWYLKLPLLYRAWNGNYATTRAAWNSSTATLVRLLGGPSVGGSGNGKTQFDSGAVEIQTGNNRLVVFGLEEAARSADIISSTTFDALHNAQHLWQ